MKLVYDLQFFGEFHSKGEESVPSDYYFTLLLVPDCDGFSFDVVVRIFEGEGRDLLQSLGTKPLYCRHS